MSTKVFSVHRQKAKKEQRCELFRQKWLSNWEPEGLCQEQLPPPRHRVWKVALAGGVYICVIICKCWLTDMGGGGMISDAFAVDLIKNKTLRKRFVIRLNLLITVSSHVQTNTSEATFILRGPCGWSIFHYAALSRANKHEPVPSLIVYGKVEPFHDLFNPARSNPCDYYNVSGLGGGGCYCWWTKY